MGSGDGKTFRSRTAILATLVVALAVAVVVLKGSEQPEADPVREPAPERPRAAPDRPVEARPDDPRQRTAERRQPAQPRERPAAVETRPAETIAVRVVDTQGRPKAGIPVDLRSAGIGLVPGRLLEAARLSDADGALAFPRAAAPRGEELVLCPGMILEEPLLVRVPPGSTGPLTVTIPPSGDLLVSVTAADGSPPPHPVTVLVLAAVNDPYADAASLARASHPVQDGRARIPLVETGTLLLVEGRAADARWTITPKLVEGPAADGAAVETTLVVSPRAGLDTAPASKPRFVAPHLGPPAAAGVAAAGQGTVRVTVRPRDALPRWPLVLQVVLKGGAPGTPGPAGRADARGGAVFAAPPGRFQPDCRLWRAMPDGWVACDLSVAAAPGAPFAVAAGRQSAVEVVVDPRAVAAAAALLARW